ncbi:MAG: hypothetical protein M1817_003648 [Caeruleum heppii]|nr:MAG: hypothetical protein M1817_003648 [Caeruleum heppii]
MEPLSLKAHGNDEEIECWDDDEDLQAGDFHFRTTSLASTATSALSSQLIEHRGSISSRMSMASDTEPNTGVDEERQVHLPANDEDSTASAIASAIDAGIPIPRDVPSSALTGGTIKRLGGKRSKKVLGDDWSEDLELPALDGGLTIRKKNAAEVADALRHFSAEFPQGPTKNDEQNIAATFAQRTAGASPKCTTTSRLDKFRDDDNDDDDGFGAAFDAPTIRVAKSRSPTKLKIPASHISSHADGPADDFEQDLEFPDDNEPLRLSTRTEAPKTPANQPDEFDEWAEGSLGTRYGGTKRDGRSNRSSSLSAMSPSVSSSFTVESEDEGLDGLVVPDGPLRFDDILKKRQQNASPDPADYFGERQAAKRAAAKEDFFSGLEIGDGDVFDSGKSTLNRNIKHKTTRTTSPSKSSKRTAAVTLSFTNKPATGHTRIPRLAGGPDRVGSTLEPVSESGGPVSGMRRPQSRMSGHSPQSSISSIPTPTTPSSRSNAPSTPSRQGRLGQRPSMKSLRPEPTTTNAQLLKIKRSMPTMRALPQSPAKSTTALHRPPSRAEGSRLGIPSRPKTPVDRSGGESSRGGIVPPVPFLPAGSSHAHSHHISIKSSGHFRRQDSESSIASNEHPTRSVSRASRAPLRSPSPTQRRRDLAPEALAREAAAKRTLTRPTKRRHFGDGSELEVFDDLPTSVNNESKFVKAPISRGAPRSSRSKLGQPFQPPDRAETPTPTPQIPMSPTRSDYTPRFARDTNASRIAREQRTGGGHTAGPLASVSTNWKAQVSARVGSHLPHPTTSAVRPKKGKRPPQKPHLIKPLGEGHNNAKFVKGMHYNPTLYRWEGNENALAPFDSTPTALPPRHTSPLSNAPTLAPSNKPALITNINAASPTVQVVGGMVFDPQRMCWLKMSHHQQGGRPGAHSRRRPPPSSSDHPMSPTTGDDISAAGDGFPDEQDDDDSDDPFAGLSDLDERPRSKRRSAAAATTQTSNSNTKNDPSAKTHAPAEPTSDDDDVTAASGSTKIADEWLVGEEFDVGPEFVRRQREEEERWRRKVERWIGGGVGVREGEGWRWGVREMVGAGRSSG